LVLGRNRFDLFDEFVDVPGHFGPLGAPFSSTRPPDR
jgi:hypothetical protein